MTTWDHLSAPASYSVPEYLWLLTYFLAFYMGTHSLLHYFCNAFNDLYYQMTSYHRVQYRQYLVSMIHAGACVQLSYSAMYHLCGTTINNKPITVFNSPACFDTCRNLHVYAILNSCAYFGFDFYLAAVVRKSTLPADM